MCFYCENPVADYMAEVVLPIIERDGWMVQAVGGVRYRAPFSYTAGFMDDDVPELIITGLKPNPAARVLNWIGPRPGLYAGERLQVDGRLLEVVHVPHPEEHLYVAHNLYGDELRAWQLVWADDRGHWPWCKGHRSGRGGQPVLGPRAELDDG
jgi:hypothetical protein